MTKVFTIIIYDTEIIKGSKRIMLFEFQKTIADVFCFILKFSI